MILKSFLISANKLTSDELVYILNNKEISLSCMIVYLSIIVSRCGCRAYMPHSQSDKLLMMSSAISTLTVSMFRKTFTISIPYVFSLLDMEKSFYLVATTSRYTHEEPLLYNHVERVSFTESQKIEIVTNTPNSLKMAVITALESGEIDLDSLPNHEIIVLKEIFRVHNDIDDNFDFSELSEMTFIQKGMFMYYLYNRRPQIFILLTHVKSIKSLLEMVSDSSYISLPKAELIIVLDDAREFSERVISEGKLSPYETKIFSEICSDIKFGVGDKLFTGMSGVIGRLFNDHTRYLEQVSRVRKSQFMSSKIVKDLDSELAGQINVVDKILKIGK